MAMVLGSEINRFSGTETKLLVGDQKLRIHYTGPDPSVSFHEGPPAGKQWSVTISFSIEESDV